MYQICVLTKVEPVHLTTPMTMFSCIKVDGLKERSTKFKVLGFGPYLILEVRHNSLKVAVSPSLGGVREVSTSMVKKWNSLHQDDPGLFDPNHSDI